MEQDNNWQKFRKSILKNDKPRKHVVLNSWGVYDAYRYIRKNKWFNIGTNLKTKDFYKIIRGINSLLAENLLNSEDIKFPHKMGGLELRKYNSSVSFKDGKLKTNLPIDWENTVKLWYQDEEARKNKTLLRLERKELYTIKYNRKNANYKNQTYYEFRVNNTLKKRLKEKIINNEIETFVFQHERNK